MFFLIFANILKLTFFSLENFCGHVFAISARFLGLSDFSNSLLLNFAQYLTLLWRTFYTAICWFETKIQVLFCFVFFSIAEVVLKKGKAYRRLYPKPFLLEIVHR